MMKSIQTCLAYFIVLIQQRRTFSVKAQLGNSNSHWHCDTAHKCSLHEIAFMLHPCKGAAPNGAPREQCGGTMLRVSQSWRRMGESTDYLTPPTNLVGRESNRQPLGYKADTLTTYPWPPVNLQSSLTNYIVSTKCISQVTWVYWYGDSAVCK